MTPLQIKLARHALGLPGPGGKKRSYRNRFYASPGSDNFSDWSKMVEAGDATRNESELRLFELTSKGAEAALLPGESLDPEDFPADIGLSTEGGK